MSDLALIKNTDLTQDDMDFMAEILNDYLDTFDEDEEAFSGNDPQARYDAAQALLGRLIGADLSGLDFEPPAHHPDCTCEWCEAHRGE